MLQCTPAAASTLEEVRTQQGIPETYGLRLFPATTPDGQTTLGVGFAEAPSEGDQVNADGGTQLFVAPEVADDLAEMALDVVPDPSENGSAEPQLVLVRQPVEDA